MATCNINDLLADGKCFAAMPLAVLQAASLELWCDISDNITPVPPPPSPPGGIFNPVVGAPIVNPDSGPLVNPDA